MPTGPRRHDLDPWNDGSPLSDSAISPESSPDPKDGYALLVEEAREYAAFLLSPAGVVSTWNEGAERIKGYRAEEIIGRHFSIFYTPEDRQAGRPEQMLTTALTDGRAATEGWRLRCDRSRFWASVLITPLFDPAGRLRGFAKMTRDETERRRHQETSIQLAEQERVAAAVADTVVSQLFSIGLDAAGALELARQPEQQKKLQKIINDTDRTIRRLRTVLFATRSACDDK